MKIVKQTMVKFKKRFLEYFNEYEYYIYREMAYDDMEKYNSYFNNAIKHKITRIKSPSEWLEMNHICMSYDEIAETMGVSTQYVYILYSNAMKKIKKIISQDEKKRKKLLEFLE